MASWSKLWRKSLTLENCTKTSSAVQPFPFLALPAELQREVVLRIYDEPWVMAIGESIDGASIKMHETNTTAPLSVRGIRDSALEAIAKRKLGIIHLPRFCSEFFWQSMQTNASLNTFTTAASTVVFREGVPLPPEIAEIKRTFPNIKQIQLGYDMLLSITLKLKYEQAVLAQSLWKELPNFVVDALKSLRVIPLDCADFSHVKFKISFSLPASRFSSLINDFNAKMVVFEVVVDNGKGSIEKIWFYGPKRFNEVGPLTTCSEKALRWARASKVDMWIRDIPDNQDVIRLAYE